MSSKPPGTEMTRAGANAALAEQEGRHRRHRDQQAERDRQRSRAGELPDPQAVLVFAKVDAGWRLYASREVPTAAFDVRSAEEHTMTDPRWAIDAEMKNMLVITKPSQGECLAELIQLWKNRDQAAAIERLRDDTRKAISQ